MMTSCKKLSPLSLALLLLPPLLYGCTTSNAVEDGLTDATNLPGGTVGCVAPNIVTENGACEPPKTLSWKRG